MQLPLEPIPIPPGKFSTCKANLEAITNFRQGWILGLLLDNARVELGHHLQLCAINARLFPRISQGHSRQGSQQFVKSQQIQVDHQRFPSLAAKHRAKAHIHSGVEEAFQCPWLGYLEGWQCIFSELPTTGQPSASPFEVFGPRQFLPCEKSDSIQSKRTSMVNFGDQHHIRWARSYETTVRRSLGSGLESGRLLIPRRN
jgi:hypothetical protein